MVDVLLKILMVEDSADDEALLRRQLLKAGHNILLTRVEDEAAIKHQLQQGDWDIVISDFRLVSFDGLDVLRWVREMDKDIPFILVSGTVGDEIAVFSMKSGANDYIMKDNSSRLVPAIERELRAAKNRRERYAMETQLIFHASHDPLTGLFNRREFERRLDELLVDAKRNDSQHVMLYMDLDQFKIINDTHGHVAGDMMLQKLCEVLQNQLRARWTILARLGGDEFGLLLPSCSEEQGMQIAETLRDSVQKFIFEWQGEMFSISMSIGVVVISQQSETSAQIFSAADRSCYAAKESGRNRVHLYLPNDSELSLRSTEMHWALRIPEALRRNRFILYSQPIVSVKSGSQPRGREFLLRMLDDEQQIVAPIFFIPAAERYDLMPSVDRWVVKAALKWLMSLPKPPEKGEFFCINLSGSSVADPKFLDFLLEQIELSRIPPEHICFEITETAVIRNLTSAIKLIETLRGIGCQFSLDDFGSGLCSFNYLKNLPVDSIKIDGSFVKNITTDKVARSIVESIQHIAQAMGMETIAEFVENEAILAVLQDIGVDYAQGYYIAHPQPL